MPSAPLPVHSYALNAPTASSARLVNVYAEAGPQGNKSPIILRTVPGVRSLATLTGGGRGLHAGPQGLFAVAGNRIYSVSAGGTASSLGTIAGTARATFADNGTQLAVSAGGSGYVYSGGSLATISDADFTSRSPGPVAYIDGYAVWIDTASGQFFSSDLLEFTAYDGLDFATAEAAPDDLVTLAVDHRQLVLIGKTTTELWYNSGVTGFPFERVPNGVIELGGVAEHGVCKLDNTVFWLASDRTARRLNGATPVRISSHGVEEKWRDYSRVDDCECFGFTQTGHLWVAYRFPTAGKCWLFDVTTNEWHERESYLGENWRVCAAVEWDGTVYVQDATTGSVGVLDANTFTEFGDTLRAAWTYQGVYRDGNRLFHGELEIGLESGVGLVTGQGSNPLLTLEASDDGGRTFRTLALRSIGLMGEYRKRVRWQRLGSAGNRVYRMSFSDPVPLTVWDTQLSVT